MEITEEQEAEMRRIQKNTMEKRHKKFIDSLPVNARQKKEILEQQGIFITQTNVEAVRIQLNETTKTGVAKFIGARILKKRGRKYGTEVPVKAKNGKTREVDLVDFDNNNGIEFNPSMSAEEKKELLDYDLNIYIINTAKLSDNILEMEKQLEELIV